MSNSNIPRVKVCDLKIKQDVESTYIVKYLQMVAGKDGRNYLNIILADNTGDLEARAWHEVEEISNRISKGQVVLVKGKVNPYQGRKQFIISKIEQVNEGKFELGDFVSTSDQNSDAMMSELMTIIQNLEDVYIKELLQLILKEPEINRRLLTWQAGKSIHHAYQGGLLEHILSCSELAVSLSLKYKVNTSYVVAGCILHDLCKIYELTDGVTTEYTEEGRLVGHLVGGVELLEKYSHQITGFPYNMKLHLKHILLSHHGEYAYGSPKIPQTKEAMLVHLIDLMDSRMAIFDDIIKKDNLTGHWSGYVKHLDRVVYKDQLPTFTAKNSQQVVSEKSKKVDPKGELKQNLGSLLKDFTITNK